MAVLSFIMRIFMPGKMVFILNEALWVGCLNIKTLSYQCRNSHYKGKIEGLVQERRNSSANALELRLSCTNPLRWSHDHFIFIMEIPYLEGQSLYWNGIQWDVLL